MNVTPPRTLRRILVVEDEDDIRTITRISLEAVGGFEVTCCSSGEEAQKVVPREPPDLILLDVMMPGQDGPATLLALRAQLGNALPPIIFMTAWVQASELAQLRALGALDVISKPFNPMTLATTLQRIWEQHHGERSADV